MPKLKIVHYFGGILDPDMFSDQLMSMDVFLNIHDIIKILISDWTTDNSHLNTYIHLIAFLVVFKLHYYNRVFCIYCRCKLFSGYNYH